MLSSNCAARGTKKSGFFKEQETSGALRNLTGIKVPILSELLLAIILF